ncbi:histidinol-phosphate transaminase [Agyrium rufum]|nr:histidinol-phosphate transaminase [Agyrium rufum]
MAKHAFDLKTCARPNILALQPYRCARDDYKDDGSNILLDANENAFGPGLSVTSNGELSNGASINGDTNGDTNGHVKSTRPEIDFLGLNRYPDPHQIELKQLLCTLRNTHVHTEKSLQPENLFVGVGSDEAIDAVLRCFCTPGKDKILTCPPTYGMYAVSAQVNDLSVVTIPLDTSNSFALRPDAIIAALSADPSIKVVYICSPGNPTANLVAKASIQKVLEHPTWNGVVVVDEAYIDFAPDGSSLAEWVTEWPNLIVMQTLSKAFGLAGIRLGAAFTSLPIASLLNNLKAPYNISSPTSVVACAALQPPSLAIMRSNRKKILAQRQRLLEELPRVPGIGQFLGGAESNFLLVEVLDKPRDQGGKPSNEVALAVYEALAEKRGVVVRFRGKEHGCLGCLRVTVGTDKEVDVFLKEIRSVLDGLFRGKENVGGESEEQKEKEANGIIA